MILFQRTLALLHSTRLLRKVMMLPSLFPSTTQCIGGTGEASSATSQFSNITPSLMFYLSRRRRKSDSHPLGAASLEKCFDLIPPIPSMNHMPSSSAQSNRHSFSMPIPPRSLGQSLPSQTPRPRLRKSCTGKLSQTGNPMLMLMLHST